MTRSIRYGMLFIATVALLAGCSDSKNSDKTTTTAAGSSTTATSKGTTVEATVKEFAVAVDPSSAPAGKIMFDVTNRGEVDHEFVVFRTDLDDAKLPTNDDGTVNEEGSGVTHIDELEEISASKSKHLEADLPAGRYVLICNLPGHYKAGMHTVFKVQ